MLRRLFKILVLFSLLSALACSAPTATPVPTSTTDIQATVDAAIKAALPTQTPTATPNRAATVAAAVQATIQAIPTATAVPTPTPTAMPTPTAIPSPTIPSPTPTATFAQRYNLTVVTSGELTLYYDPATTAQIQVDWVIETYQETLGVLSSLFGVSSLPTEAYLLSPESYAEVFGAHQLSLRQEGPHLPLDVFGVGDAVLIQPLGEE